MGNDVSLNQRQSSRRIGKPRKKQKDRQWETKEQATQQNRLYEQIMLADIARMNRPFTTMIPNPVQEKPSSPRRLLDQKNIRTITGPTPITSNSKSITWRPFGVTRKELPECHAGSALLGGSFVGSSVLEIVTDMRQAPASGYMQDDWYRRNPRFRYI